jgi:hypothetical protein
MRPRPVDRTARVARALLACAIACVLALAAATTAQAANFTAAQASDLVLGAANFTTVQRGANQSWALDMPRGVNMDATGRVYVADAMNNRIAVWNTPFGSPPFPNNGQAPSYVLGNLSATDYRYDCTSQRSREPGDVITGGGRMLMVDSSHHRLLLWDAIPTTNAAAANRVVGQTGLASCSTTRLPAQNTLSNIEAAWTDGTRIVVADTDNNRVLIWNSWPTANDQNADLVLGQPDFVSIADDNLSGPTSQTMDLPRGVWSNGTKLLVSDSGNDRVLVWNTWPTVNDQAADLVLGQPTMTSTGASCSASGMDSPYRLSSNGTKIAITERRQHRVLLWDTWPTANGQAANRALGQTSLTSCSRNHGSSTLDAVGLEFPSGVWTDGTNLLVSDTEHHRVLGWAAWPAANGAAATRVLGATGYTSAAANAMTMGRLVEAIWNRASTDARGSWLSINPLTRGLFMTSSENSTLSYYTGEPTANDQIPDWLMGQAASDQGICNRPTGGSAAQDTVCNPMGSWTDGTKLLVADTQNDRVLVWNAFPVNQSDTPDLVLGQSNWTNNGSGRTQTTMDKPVAVASDGTHLAVLDKENTRVLLWDTWPTSIGQAPDRVLGQPSWTTGAVARTQTGLDNPMDIDMWNGKIVVADRDGARIMIWNSWPTATFNQPADAVVGAANFTSTGTIQDARGVALESNALFFTDDDCAMVLDPVPTSGAVSTAAATTIGTCVNGSGDVDPSATALDNPMDIEAYAGRVWVVNQGHGRVMRWTDTVTPTITVAPVVTNGCAGTTFTWTTSESGTTEVYYGPTSQAAYTGYPSSSVDLVASGLTHAPTIANIPPGTYFYRVRTVDWNNQAVVSSEGSFTVPAAPAAPSGQFSGDAGAQAGTANNASITNRTPWLSWTNNAPCAMDRQRTQVVTTPSTGVVALWHLDGDGTDASGNGRTMTLGTAPATPTYTSSLRTLDRGAHFDGVDDYLDTPYDPAYDLDVFTVELWFRTTSVRPNDFNYLISKEASGPYRNNFSLEFDTRAAQQNLLVEVTSGGAFRDVRTPYAPYLDGHWHHVAAVADAGGTLRLYVDGVQKNSMAIGAGGVDNPVSSIRLGRAVTDPTYVFGGDIDEVRISNVARSAAEIAGYYRSRLPHMKTMWDSDTTDAGAAQAACAQAARCADLGYGATGSSTPLAGGRYYARQKLRVGAGTWSQWSGYDWLETRLGKPADLYVGNTSAATGVANVTGITNATPRLSWRSNANVSVDRQQTQVVTTPLDDVVGLWHVDGTTTDTSATANPLTLETAPGTPSYAAGGTNFGQALSFDGVDDGAWAPANPAYELTQFTVEAWFNVTTLANSTWPTILIKDFGGPTNRNYALYFGQATNRIYGDVSAGGAGYGINAPAAAYLDGRWHHVAMTLDGSRTLRLYVDGVSVGTPVTLATTVDTPSGAVYVGRNGAGGRLQGMLDDVRISSVARTAGEIAGYYATRRPHYDTLWDSGEQTVTACADLARCNDVTYAGAALIRTGARYYARARVRPNAQTWTDWADWDWFETTPVTTVSVAPTVSLGSAIPGFDAAVGHDVQVATTNASGYSLTATGPSDSWGMTDGSAPHVPRWSGAPGSPSAWAAGTSGGFGLTVVSSTGGKDTARWGTGTTETDYVNNRYVGLLSSTSTLLQSTSVFSAATDTVRVGFRSNVDSTIPPGAYSATITFTAVANP